MAIMGSIKKFLLPIPKSLPASLMSTSQNINARTVVPAVVNPESFPVDSDLEVDLKEIQREAVAEQV